MGRRLLLVLTAGVAMAATACFPPPTGGGPANVAPSASLDASTTSGVAHLSVDFDGAGSTDADGTIVSWAWDFGDGNTSTDAAAQNLYTEAGSYTVSLTVTDDDGASDVETVAIEVTDDPTGRYVATDGANDTDCSDSLAPCGTVQHAVGQAAAGDTVYIDSGTYPELVYFQKNLNFKGANQGNSAGAHADARRAESTLKGIRTGTAAARPGTVKYAISIDGLAFDPQGDATLVPAQNQALVWLFGGHDVVVENNAFVGGPVSPECGSACATNTDHALEIRSGDIVVQDNGFANFKRTLNFYQTGPSGQIINSALFKGNLLTGYTSRGLQIAPAGANPSMPGVTVEDNVFDATGFTFPESAPGSIVTTTGTNTYTNNTFIGSSSAIYLYTCVSNYVTGPQTITDNTFEGNRSGVVVVADNPANCGVHNVDGSVIANNNFSSGWDETVRSGVSVGTTYFDGGGGPIDASCNWWGVDTGANTGAQTATVHADVITGPWLVAPAPDGACTGS